MHPHAFGAIVTGIVGAILVFVVIVGMQATFYYVEQAELYDKVYSQPPEELTRLRATQQERLNSYRWIDEQNRVAAIPIDRATELVVEELSQAARTTEAALAEQP